MANDESQTTPADILKSYPEEVQTVVKAVLKKEREMLSRHAGADKDDLVIIVKDIVQ